MQNSLHTSRITSVVGLIVILFVAGGLLLSIQKTKKEIEKESEAYSQRAPVISLDKSILLQEIEQKEDEGKSSTYQGDLIAGSFETIPFIEFSEADYLLAKEANQKILLLFFADWCPTCKTELKNSILPFFNETTLAGDVVVFHIHIEDRATGAVEKALQREFQILGRHVKLFLNTDGSIFKKTAPENWPKPRYEKELKEFIEG